MEQDYKDNKMIDKFQFNDIDNIFNDEKVLNELTNDEKLKILSELVLDTNKKIDEHNELKKKR